MTISQIGMLVAMVFYLGMMIYIGFKVSDRNKTMGDFFLGGRGLGPLVVAMSAEASDMSSWLLMGLPGVAYLSGVADAGWTAIGLAVGTYLNWLIVAKRLRRYSEKINAITIPEFFSKRFHDEKNTLTLIAAIWIIIFFVPYTASGFCACGKLFNSLFGVDYHIAMIVSAIVIVLYTTLGGFLAASTTDFIQSIVMTIALLIVMIFGIGVAGGIDQVIANASKLPGYFHFMASYDTATHSAIPLAPLSIISTMAWGLGYFGMPHILLRFMAIENEEKIALSRRVASIWVVISMAVSVFIGIVGLQMSHVGVFELLSGSQSETIIVKIASLLSQKGLFFAIIAGVVLSGILASTMSTSDSQLLAASSSVSNDILVNVFHVQKSQKELLFISRITLVLIAVVGVVLAWDPDSSVFKIVSFAWAGFGASFGPVMLLSLFWKRANRQGALAGLLTGGATVFIWHFIIKPMGGLLGLYELLPAFIIAIVVNIVVSSCTSKPDQEIIDTFESV